jgi:transcriptional regulator with XRE-family HTH domain
MRKTVHSRDARLLLQLLREARRRAGLSQSDLARKLSVTQSFISKLERGERRLDVLELRAVCRAVGTPFIGFVERLERMLPG